MPVPGLLLDAVENNRHDAIDMPTPARNASRLVVLLPHAETDIAEGCGRATPAEQGDPVPDQLIRGV
jgi:hypothetical protein